MSTASQASTHTHEFKAEIKQLLDILIHSVYTSKDVFLRELISNASDALEKVRFATASGQPVHSPEIPLEIRIETTTEGDRKLLVISDTGIGMTEEEVHANLGTIAHSGATAFLDELARTGQGGENPGVNLIGRFGVGFYSVFMVAERVVVTTRGARPDARPVVWTSDGLGSYAIEALAEDRPRGTRIEILLRKDDEKFAEPWAVKSTINRYSNFVPFPIVLDGQRINQATALWREPPSQVKDEQYNEFFKLLSHDQQDPILRLHFSADAPMQYSALLYVPSSNPEVLGFGRGEVSLQLYVKRVLIDNENKNLLPAYLRFVKGVIESDDLPLNISRETLQENRLVAKIRESLTRKLLDLMLDMARSQPDDYRKLWETFGRILKEGYSDFTNHEKFVELLRFNSSRHDDAHGLIGLSDYVAAMPAGQKAIYYLSGPSREALLRDPRLELFRKKQIEVLYLDELADEFVLTSVARYKDKPLVSADQVDPDELKDLGQSTADRPAEESEANAVDIGPLVDRFKQILGQRVTDVRASARLVDSPACLVSDEKQLSGHMDKMMRLVNKNTELPKRVMELNPAHPLIRNLTKLVQANPSDEFVQLSCEQLFEGAMLADGYLTDPHTVVERMNQILTEAAGLKSAAVH